MRVPFEKELTVVLCRTGWEGGDELWCAGAKLGLVADELEYQYC
jgi:hypothetical protein